MIKGTWEVDGERDGVPFRWTYSVGGSECCAGVRDDGPSERKRILWWVDCFGVVADGKANTTDEIPMVQAMIEGMVDTARSYHLGDEEAPPAS